MQVKCEYCDSYVEASNNSTCPCCGAPLGASIAAETARLKREQAEAEIKAQELAVRQREQARDDQILNTALNVASTVGGVVLGNVISGAISGRHSIGHSIIRGLFRKR